MTSTRSKLSVATRIRRSLKRGLSPMEVAKATGASVSYVYTIKARMDAEPRPFANPPAPAPEIVKLEVPLIPFAPIPIPQGIAGLHEVKEEPPVAAHAASEIVEETVIEKPDNYKYVWALAGILLLTALVLWYFGHRG